MSRPLDISYVELGFGDIPEIQRVLVSCEDYFAETRGRSAQATEARTVFDELPPGCSPTQKHVLGCRDAEDRLVGAADVVEGWPDAETWMIGLLVVEPLSRGHGIGGSFVTGIATLARAAGARRLRVGVFAHRPAVVRFWEQQGFAIVARMLRDEGLGERELVVLVRELDPAPA